MSDDDDEDEEDDDDEEDEDEDDDEDDCEEGGEASVVFDWDVWVRTRFFTLCRFPPPLLLKLRMGVWIHPCSSLPVWADMILYLRGQTTWGSCTCCCTCWCAWL